MFHRFHLFDWIVGRFAGLDRRMMVFGLLVKNGPLEFQIAYKLSLVSEKDGADALHLYQGFEENLEDEKLENYSKRLKVRKELDELRQA